MSKKLKAACCVQEPTDVRDVFSCAGVKWLNRMWFGHICACFSAEHVAQIPVFVTNSDGAHLLLFPSSGEIKVGDRVELHAELMHLSDFLFSAGVIRFLSL